MHPQPLSMNETLEAALSESRRLSAAGPNIEYEEFVKLVDLRDLLLKQIETHKPLTEEQNEKIHELQLYDAEILGHMQRLKDEAQEALARVNTSRRQSNAYSLPSVQDSVMFDSKK